jgi:hypothetical protein
MEKIFDKIKNMIDIKQDHVFINNKMVLSAKSLKSIKEKIKESFENPKKDVKCYIVSIAIHTNYKHPLTINCSQYTITPKLNLVYKDDDVSQTFTFSEKELLDYNFKLDYIKKIIKAIKKNLISFETSSVSISDVI